MREKKKSLHGLGGGGGGGEGQAEQSNGELHFRQWNLLENKKVFYCNIVQGKKNYSEKNSFSFITIIDEPTIIHTYRRPNRNSSSMETSEL